MLPYVKISYIYPVDAFLLARNFLVCRPFKYTQAWKCDWKRRCLGWTLCSNHKLSKRRSDCAAQCTTAVWKASLTCNLYKSLLSALTMLDLEISPSLFIFFALMACWMRGVSSSVVLLRVKRLFPHWRFPVADAQGDITGWSRRYLPGAGTSLLVSYLIHGDVNLQIFAERLVRLSWVSLRQTCENSVRCSVPARCRSKLRSFALLPKKR